ncbi:hypothetical protein KKJ28_12520 [Xenorhabdus bovienii]|nr:hypothetical protein [Xenorhabdus bovienii]MDE9539923.1 hypothetical protein [Xenorhabdus bovienii]
MPHEIACQYLRTGITAAHSRLLSLFHHAGPRQRCLTYLRGLLSDVDVKIAGNWLNGPGKTHLMVFSIYWSVPIGMWM